MELRVGTTLELDIERLAYGGDGIARPGSRIGAHVIFVPLSVPGDRVRARIIELHPRFARAEIEAVLVRSDARREAHCKHFGTCGGCQLQHVSQPSQLDAKVGFLRDALERIGRLALDVDIEVVSGPEWSYRTRLDLALQSGELGLFRRASREIVPIEMCPISTPAIERTIAKLRAGRVPLPDGVESVTIESAGEDALVTPFPAAAREDTPPVVERSVAGFMLRSDARAFFQANGELLPDLVRVATEGADGALALDLYAGVGLFTLPLSRHFDSLIAIEESSVAVAFGRENTRRNEISNVRWRTSRTDRWLARAASELPAVDFVLLDPPRAGAGASTMRALAALRAREVRYVSCDPTTLARDLAAITAERYAITRIVLVDMFPQTTHVESVAMLRRSV